MVVQTHNMGTVRIFVQELLSKNPVRLLSGLDPVNWSHRDMAEELPQVGTVKS
jgi:hypothetical protein